jgi:hypothetical protein
MKAKKPSKKENFNADLTKYLKECHASLLELKTRYESLNTIIKFFHDNFQLFQDKDSEIIKVFNLGSCGIQFVTDVYYFAIDLEEEYKYRVLLNFHTKFTVCSRPYHKNTKEATFNFDYTRNFINDNNKLNLSAGNENIETTLENLQQEIFTMRQTIMNTGNLNNHDCLLADFFIDTSNCFELDINFDRMKESCQDITITKLADKTQNIISYFKKSYEKDFVSETLKLITYDENIKKYKKKITKNTKFNNNINNNIEATNTRTNNDINNNINSNIEATNTNNMNTKIETTSNTTISDSGKTITSALKKNNTSSVKKTVGFSKTEKEMNKEEYYVSDNDEIKFKDDHVDLNTLFPSLEHFCTAFGLENKDSIPENLLSLKNLNYEIPNNIVEKFYKKFKFSKINHTTFNDKSFYLTNLMRLQPKQWLSVSVIDSFYSLLNRLENAKNLPVAEMTYFVKTDFLWGNQLDIFYNNVGKLNIQDFVEEKNLNELENVINKCFDKQHNPHFTGFEIMKKMIGDKSLFLKYRFLVFPTYVPEFHFSTIVVENSIDISSVDDNRKYTIYNYDSLPSSKHNKKTVEFAKLKLVEMFLNRLHAENSTNFTFSFEIINLNKQAQFNSYDCGVFICMKAVDYFNKKTNNILDQNDTHDFRKMMFGMLLNDFLTEYEEIEMKTIESVNLLNENEIQLLGDLKNIQDKDKVNPEAIISLTSEKVSPDNKVNENNLQTAIESFITIEVVRSNLKDVNTVNFNSLCCKEFLVMFNNKPSTQTFWQFINEIFLKLTKEIEFCFSSDRVFKLLNKTYIERLCNTNLIESKGFVEKQYMQMQNSLDIETKQVEYVLSSPTKQVIDFPKSFYENPLSLLDDIESKYTTESATEAVTIIDTRIAASELLALNENQTKSYQDRLLEEMKNFNLRSKQTSIKRKVYLMSFRLFESIAVQYLEDKKLCDIDITKQKNILKGHNRLNPNEIDYFNSFVMAAYQQINSDPNQNDYIKVLLHLVTNKKTESTVNVENVLSIADLMEEVKDVPLEDLVENYKKAKLRPSKGKDYTGQATTSRLNKRKKK